MASSPSSRLMVASSFPGEIDAYSGPALADRLRELSHGAERVALDLTGVSFIDSSGLHALIRLLQSVPSLHVMAVNGRIERLLEITGTSEVILRQPNTNSDNPSS